LSKSKAAKVNLEPKQRIIENLREKFQKSSLALLTDYRGNEKGLTVQEINELRKSFKQKAGELKVVKNTLIRRTLEELEISGLDSQLYNPTALIFSYGDPVGIAKILVDFARKKKTATSAEGIPIIKAGYLEGKILTPAQVRELAMLPGKQEMLAKLVSTIAAPISSFLRVLTEPMAKLVRILPQIKTE